MSMFDPYALYTHPQRKSHKGQIQQKRPYDMPYAITQRELERALAVVQSYGYNINRPITSYLSAPFYLAIDDINEDTYSFGVNNLWSRMLLSSQSLRDFITEHPTADTSNVFIGISSAFFLFHNCVNARITFINDNDYATISPSFNFPADGSVVAFTFGPSGAANYFLSYDAEYNSTNKHGETVVYNRGAASLPGVLNHCTVTNRWEELNSQSHLQPDMALFSVTQGNDSYLMSYAIQGMISIQLN